MTMMADTLERLALMTTEEQVVFLTKLYGIPSMDEEERLK